MTFQHIHNYTSLLNLYEDSIQSITHQYFKQSDQFAINGVAYLSQMFAQYSSRKTAQPLLSHSLTLSSSTLSNQTHSSPNQYADFSSTKSINKESLPTSSPHKHKKLKSCKQKSLINAYQPSQDSILHQLQQQNNQDSESLLIDDSQQTLPTQKQEFHRKTIIEMLQESEKKMKQNLDTKSHLEDLEFDVDDHSEYEMSDYSSNESSNDDDKEEHYVSELFDGIFMKNQHKKMSIGSNATTQATYCTQQYEGSQYDKENINTMNFAKNTKQVPKQQKKVLKFNLNFMKNNIMESPKKQKNTRKRLLIGEKKVPHWAEDFQKIKAINFYHKQHTNAADIFGKCIVENLNSNILFSKNQKIQRTSSAKWRKTPFLTK